MTYELTAVEGGTKFSLVTTNVPAGTKTESGMAQGGKFIIETFKQVVEQGRPSFGTRLMLSLMGLAQPLTPKKCRSENWTFEQIEEL